MTLGSIQTFWHSWNWHPYTSVDPAYIAITLQWSHRNGKPKKSTNDKFFFWVLCICLSFATTSTPGAPLMSLKLLTVTLTTANCFKMKHRAMTQYSTRRPLWYSPYRLYSNTLIYDEYTNRVDMTIGREEEASFVVVSFADCYRRCPSLLLTMNKVSLYFPSSKQTKLM